MTGRERYRPSHQCFFVGFLSPGSEFELLCVPVAKQSVETIRQILLGTVQLRGVGGGDCFLERLEEGDRLVRNHRVGDRLERQSEKNFWQDFASPPRLG